MTGTFLCTSRKVANRKNAAFYPPGKLFYSDTDAAAAAGAAAGDATEAAAGAAGCAAAAFAAASAVCIYYVIIGVRFAPPYMYMMKCIQQKQQEKQQQQQLQQQLRQQLQQQQHPCLNNKVYLVVLVHQLMEVNKVGMATYDIVRA